MGNQERLKLRFACIGEQVSKTKKSECSNGSVWKRVRAKREGGKKGRESERYQIPQGLRWKDVLVERQIKKAGRNLARCVSIICNDWRGIYWMATFPVVGSHGALGFYGFHFLSMWGGWGIALVLSNLLILSPPSPPPRLCSVSHSFPVFFLSCPHWVPHWVPPLCPRTCPDHLPFEGPTYVGFCPVTLLPSAWIPLPHPRLGCITNLSRTPYCRRDTRGAFRMLSGPLTCSSPCSPCFLGPMSPCPPSSSALSVTVLPSLLPAASLLPLGPPHTPPSTDHSQASREAWLQDSISPPHSFLVSCPLTAAFDTPVTFDTLLPAAGSPRCQTFHHSQFSVTLLSPLSTPSSWKTVLPWFLVCLSSSSSLWKPFIFLSP